MYKCACMKFSVLVIISWRKELLVKFFGVFCCCPYDSSVGKFKTPSAFEQVFYAGFI